MQKKEDKTGRSMPLVKHTYQRKVLIVISGGHKYGTALDVKREAGYWCEVVALLLARRQQFLDKKAKQGNREQHLKKHYKTPKFLIG